MLEANIKRFGKRVKAGKVSIMGDVVSLSRYRKNRERRILEAKAAENRARYGRTQDERRRDEIEKERRQTDLDNKKLD